MFRSHSARNQNPRLLRNSTFLSQFTSQSSPNPNKNNKSPPRKARQSARRIINLLSPSNPKLTEPLKTLETSPHSLSSSQASILINSVSNPLISFDFYRYLKSLKPLFQFDSNVYCSLIKSQIQSINPKLHKVQFYFSEMKKHKVCFSHDDLVSFIELVVPKFVEFGEFFAREVLEGGEFEECSYNYLIRVYAKHGMCKDAVMIAERAKARFEDLSLEFYASVMNVFRLSGDVRSAMELFLEMEDRGVVPDEEIFTVLLGILCKGGSVKLSLVVLEEMRRVGYRPDECLAIDLMEMLMKERMVAEAGHLIEEGIIQDTESIVLHVESMKEKTGLLKAVERVENMRKSGLNVDGRVYASLIRSCGKMGLIEEAEKLFEENKFDGGYENRGMMYSSMIFVYSERQMRTKAEMVFDEFEAHPGLIGSEKVFSYMISMYGESGLFDNVEKMFNIWKRSGYGIHVDVYVALIDAFSKWGKLDKAKCILMEMRQVGVHPNSSMYSSMLEGYVRLGLVNRASALFDEYKLVGLEVEKLVPDCVISILIQAGRYMELGVYLDKLTREGVYLSRNKGLPVLQLCRDDSCLHKLGKLLQ